MAKFWKIPSSGLMISNFSGIVGFGIATLVCSESLDTFEERLLEKFVIDDGTSANIAGLATLDLQHISRMYQSMHLSRRLT